MTTFVYSRSGKTARLRQEEIPSASCTDDTPIRYLSDEDEGSQRPRFKALLSAIGSRDTLIVDRLQDLGNDMQEIRVTISLLLRRTPRIFVHQGGALNHTPPSGGRVLNALDALAEAEHGSASTLAGTEIPRAARRRVKVAGPLRSAIVTDYSLGESISSLARRYELPRSTVARLVQPARPDEPDLPLAFGD